MHRPRTRNALGKQLQSLMAMIVCTAIDLVLLAAALYWPALQTVLRTRPLTVSECLIALATAFVVYLMTKLVCSMRIVRTP
jgi:hypothetical protein